MSDPNETERPRLSRRGALKAALFSTAALAAGLRPSGADPLPVPNERAMPPVGGPGPDPATLPGGGQIPVIVDTGTGNATAGPFHLPPLPYAYDALEPFIDAETMRLHHDQHHAAYVKNLNAAYARLPKTAALPRMTGDPVVDAGGLISGMLNFPYFLDPDNPAFQAIRNNGGGHYNHSLFWRMMKKGGGKPTADLASALNKQFGSYAGFQDQFTKLALARFGSGWVWLSLDLDRTLLVESTANQDSPTMRGGVKITAQGDIPIRRGATPLLGLDVWEHAYYLKYRNRRAEYVAAWFHVIDWDFVNARYDEALKAV